jgi:hypothetical protein
VTVCTIVVVASDVMGIVSVTVAVDAAVVILVVLGGVTTIVVGGVTVDVGITTAISAVAVVVVVVVWVIKVVAGGIIVPWLLPRPATFPSIVLTVSCRGAGTRAELALHPQ